MTDTDTQTTASMMEPDIRLRVARSSWMPYSQRRIVAVATLWALAFVMVASMSIYLHAHRLAQFPGDVGLIVLIQQIHAPLIVGFINLASDANWPMPAGITVFAVLLLMVIFRRWRYVLTTLMAGFLADGLSFALNGWVHRPRPHGAHIHAIGNIGLSSYPSGHVSHVTAFYGFLLFLSAQELRAHPRESRWIHIAQAICVYFLVFIGVSRILEGQHWPSDVFASYLLGGMTLVITIVTYQLLGRFKMRNSAGIEQNADQVAHRAADSPIVTGLAHVGYAAKAVVYLIIGGLALAAALKIGGGLVDQTGATNVIYNQPFGKYLLIAAGIGWFGYALWCVIEATLDTEHYGSDAKGVVARLGYAVVAVAYGALAYLAFGLATGKSSGGKSSNTQAHDWTARLLAAPGGVALVIVLGLVVLAVAGILFRRAYTADFRRQLEMGQAGANVEKGVILLGRIGNAALGSVFTIIGVFFIVAALQHNPDQAKGLSGALSALLAQPFGNLLLAIVALGLLAYGAYSLAQARYRRIRAA